mgnify:CR=1 FL=1
MEYDFQAIVQMIYDFCNQDLSAFYFDISKDSLYCDGENNVLTIMVIHKKQISGKQNNKPLPSDVYVYMIEIEYNSGKRELFSGDITLLR